MRQSNTTFVNLRAALDDLDPLVETAKPATKNLAPFLSELRPVLSKAVPVFKNLRLSVSRKGFANDTAETLGFLPAVQERVVEGLPARRTGDRRLPADAQLRPRLHAGHLQRLRQARPDHRLLRRQRPLRPRPAGDLNLFKRNSGNGELEPITPSEQYDAFGGSAAVRRPCPGGATQSAPDGSNPFTEPPFAGSGVSPSSACDPADAPPGP